MPPTTDLTPAELDRLGLDPLLLAQAAQLPAGRELTDWLEQLPAGQHDAGRRVVTYCLLEHGQYCDLYDIPTGA